MKILAVGAHPDDVELGCGATLARHAQAGDDVLILTLTHGALSRIDAADADAEKLVVAAKASAALLGARVSLSTFPDQRLDTVGSLDINRTIEAAVEMHQPEVVYTHFIRDLNRDHRLAAEATMVACRPQGASPVRKLLSYEVPSSTDWSPEPFWPTVFHPITGDCLEKKVRALNFYGGEIKGWPHPRSLTGIRALAELRGALCGYFHAEAFVLVREIA